MRVPFYVCVCPTTSLSISKLSTANCLYGRIPTGANLVCSPRHTQIMIFYRFAAPAEEGELFLKREIPSFMLSTGNVCVLCVLLLALF